MMGRSGVFAVIPCSVHFTSVVFCWSLCGTGTCYLRRLAARAEQTLLLGRQHHPGQTGPKAHAFGIFTPMWEIQQEDKAIRFSGADDGCAAVVNSYIHFDHDQRTEAGWAEHKYVKHYYCSVVAISRAVMCRWFAGCKLPSVIKRCAIFSMY